MPRRKGEEVDYGLWVRALKPWMRLVLEILAEAEGPLTATEILERLADRLDDQELQRLAAGKAHSKLLHFLNRLRNHGLARRLRIGYYHRYAWQLTEEARRKIKEASKRWEA